MKPHPTTRPRFTWNALLWALIYPRRAHRTVPTIPGTVLIALSLGIGMAAYNSSSNILFLTLALLLTSLMLSGVLSWLNLRKVTWTLRAAPALRVGHDTVVAVELRNAKSFLPTYGLRFNLLAQADRFHGELKPETTLRANSAEIRAALAQAEAAEIRGHVDLGRRLEPGAEARLDWVVRPPQRGLLRLELVSVGSYFPFGFLRKEIGTAMITEAIVWPAPIEYRRHPVGSMHRTSGDEKIARAGSGSDLLAVRRYTAGDSHRLIHWKASARTRQLLVRQFAAETAQGWSLWLRTEAATWPRPEQFEVLVSFAATLVEDLYRSGKLVAVALDGEPPILMRRMQDLESLLNRLAVLQPAAAVTGNAQIAGQPNVMTFAPDGTRGVAAFVDGQVAASA